MVSWSTSLVLSSVTVPSASKNPANHALDVSILGAGVSGAMCSTWHTRCSCTCLAEFRMLPLMLLIRLIIPCLLWSRHRSALTPDRGLIEPPSLSCRYLRQTRSAEPIVISQDVLPALLTWRLPPPSMSPASHWQNGDVKNVARVVSEVPTRLDTWTICTGRWLPANRAPDIMFWLRRGIIYIPLTYIVMRPDSKPFLQIAQCIMDVSMKGRCVQPKNPYSILT